MVFAKEILCKFLTLREQISQMIWKVHSSIIIYQRQKWVGRVLQILKQRLSNVRSNKTKWISLRK